MIRHLPGGGMYTGIGSAIGANSAEHDERAAAELWTTHMDSIRMRARQHAGPVRGRVTPARNFRNATAGRAGFAPWQLQAWKEFLAMAPQDPEGSLTGFLAVLRDG